MLHGTVGWVVPLPSRWPDPSFRCRPAIEESCKGHCPKQLKELEECTARVEKLIAEAKPGEEVPYPPPLLPLSLSPHQHLQTNPKTSLSRPALVLHQSSCTSRHMIPDSACLEQVVAHCTGQYQDFWHCIDHCVSTLHLLSEPARHPFQIQDPHKQSDGSLLCFFRGRIRTSQNFQSRFEGEGV
jgi:hypothetical protein